MSLSSDIFDLDGDYDTPLPQSRAITPSHGKFPTSDKVMEEAGMPFGCEILPFLPIPSSRLYSEAMIDAETVLRCTHCSAYISPLCRMESSRWICILCGQENSMTRSEFVRFKGQRESDLSVRDYAFPLPQPSKKFLHALQLKSQHAYQDQGTNKTVFRPSMPPPPSTSLHRGRGQPTEAVSTSVPSPIPLESHSVYFSPASRRPLVHVFLLPARMGADVMEGIIDSLMAGIQVMHSDAETVLLSYADLIGVYSLRDYHQGSDEDPIPIKYASYTDFEETQNQDDDLFLDDVPIRLTSEMYVNIDDTLHDDDPILDFAQHGCLKEVADFHETYLPLRYSRQMLLRALESFGERCLKSNRSKPVVGAKDQHSVSEDALLNSDVERAVLSVVDWILCYDERGEQPLDDGGDTVLPNVEDDDEYDSGREVQKGFWGSIKDWMGWTQSESNLEYDSKKSWLSRRGPIDDCSGVVLHVFITQEVKFNFFA